MVIVAHIGYRRVVRRKNEKVGYGSWVAATVVRKVGRERVFGEGKRQRILRLPTRNHSERSSVSIKVFVKDEQISNSNITGVIGRYIGRKMGRNSV